jgi:magnesium-transporting ATPase (P-type)
MARLALEFNPPTHPFPHVFSHERRSPFVVNVTELWLDCNFLWEGFSRLLPRQEAHLEHNPDAEQNTFGMFHLIASVCNNARFLHDPSVIVNIRSEVGLHALESAPMLASAVQPGHLPAPKVEYFGSPTEVALLRFCNELRSSEDVRTAHPVVFEIPFNSKTKWHLVVVRRNLAMPTMFTTLLKGAPEIVVEHCTHFLLDVSWEGGGREGGVSVQVDDGVTDTRTDCVPP